MIQTTILTQNPEVLHAYDVARQKMKISSSPTGRWLEHQIEFWDIDVDKEYGRIGFWSKSTPEYQTMAPHLNGDWEVWSTDIDNDSYDYFNSEGDCIYLSEDDSWFQDLGDKEEIESIEEEMIRHLNSMGHLTVLAGE